MAKYNAAVLTDAGADLLARSITEQFKIEFFKMIIGSGEYSAEEKTEAALKARTQLKSQKQEVGFSNISATEENAVKLTAIISNSDLSEGYRITEIGIIARRSDDEESEGILYSLCIAKEADYIPAKESPIEITQEYYTKVANAENVTINVEMEAYAPAGDFLEHIKKLASEQVLGHVRLTNSDDVTNSEGLALAATENNPDIEGTLASYIKAIMDESVIEPIFRQVFTKLPDEPTDPTAMTVEDIEEAIATEWTVEESTDSTAMTVEDIEEAIATEWTGEESTDPTAMTSEDVISAITSV